MIPKVIHDVIEVVGLWKHGRGQPKFNNGAWVESRVGFEDSFPQVGCWYPYCVSDRAEFWALMIFSYFYTFYYKLYFVFNGFVLVKCFQYFVCPRELLINFLE